MFNISRAIPDCDAAQVTQRLIEEALKKFNFQGFFPGKLRLQNVLKIRKGFDKEENLVRYIERLIMLDRTARDDFITAECNTSHNDTLSSSNSKTVNDYQMKNLRGGSDNEPEPHPLDYFLLAFLCCDPDLRQTFIQKLFLCRLAIPLLYPTFNGDELELLLWPLRSIIPEWKQADGKLVELDAASSPTSFVSFCRVGKSDRYRKSKIANDLISDEQHDTFFHWDCLNGTRSRIFSEGVVEGSWYIPSGRASDTFKNLTMVLNLRGDSLDHSRQVEFLSLVSSVVVLLIDVDRLADDDTCTLIRSLQSKGAKVIVLLYVSTTNVNMTVVNRQRESYEKKKGSEELPKFVPSFTDKIHRNATDIKLELRKEIIQLCCKLRNKSLSDIASNMNYITIDESHKLCLQSKAIAKSVMAYTNLPISQIKCEEISLQGQSLWQKWSILLKKKCRPSTSADKIESTVQKRDRLQDEMDAIRKEQLKACLNPSQLMNAFVHAFVEHAAFKGHQQIDFLLQWLRLLLDQNSRSILSGFNHKYQERWSKLQSVKGTQGANGQQVKSLQAKVSEAEEQLAKASFGLEHLMREMGQMYEAVEESGSASLNHSFLQNIRKLPMIMASLLLRGQPLELMDGDAANIPLSWLKAVLSELKSLVGEKKLFVVSVLGVQSSGKSTLLNTIFGLQFAVSAGRCTRGVYMQLVQCETGLPFDYACVVDTEGLRAPELGMQKYDHDNELATLVIGLGDLTIINIKGENYAEMKDVIQIAVHAFLRMKLVSKYENHHRCVFVHQNVPATNAKEKTRNGRQKLQENLDEMTKEAAAQEKFANVQQFDQIITFNCNKDVWLFPDLWHGDPPMAPANPGYSTSVKEIRDKIFTEMALKQTGFLLCDDLSQRIKDLWQGILADDFVFSFRNSLEMKAYTGLERKYQQVTLNLEEGIMQWESDTAEVRIGACDTEEKIRICQLELRSDLDKCVAALGETLKASLIDFCENDIYASIVIQWKQNKINLLQAECDKQKLTTLNNIIELLSAKDVELRKDKEDDKHKLDIMQQACQLAQSMKKQRLSEKELERKFEELWNRWVKVWLPRLRLL